MDDVRPADTDRVRGLHCDRRNRRNESVELAPANAVRMAANHLLAGAGAAGPVPHPLRGPRHEALWAFQLPSADGRALGKNDAGGARKVPAELARTLRFLRATYGCEAECVRVARKSAVMPNFFDTQFVTKKGKVREDDSSNNALIGTSS